MNSKLKISLSKLLLFTSVLSVLFCRSSIGQMSQFPYQSPDSSYNGSLILTARNNDLLFYWSAKDNLFQSRSTDNGLTWQDPVWLTNTASELSVTPPEISGITTKYGRLIITYKVNSYNNYYNFIFSDDNGYTWSKPASLGVKSKASGGTISESSTRLFFIYSKISTSINDIYYKYSNDQGGSWSTEITFAIGPVYGSISPITPNKIIMVYQNGGLFYSLSTNDGFAWSSSTAIVTNDTSISTPRIVKDQSGKLWLFYLKNFPSPFPGITQKDILYQTSSDSGVTWEAPINFTTYKGVDDYYNVTVNGNNPFVSFSSDRYDTQKSLNNKIWYGRAGITVDTNAPPYLYKSQVSANPPLEHQPFNLDAYVDCAGNISYVFAGIRMNEGNTAMIKMYDDGTHGDIIANDKTYTCQVPGIAIGDVMQSYIQITDQNANSCNYVGPVVTIPFNNSFDSILVDVNRFNLPINNIGVLGDQLISGQLIAGGKYDGNIVLYGGGFYLSGLSNGFLWANGSFSDDRIYDYVPGRVGTIPQDPKNILYVVRAGDPPFGQSWQDWKIAVSQGADFYDGNKDGIYNPVDLNGNGIWDPDEDRPDLLGDFTAWCVYNDGAPAVQRIFSDVPPQGIDIQQTVFAQKDSADLNNVVFVRYRIINRGTVANVMDSVYFGAVNDVDIGDNGAADLDGCDTLLNSAYTYHDKINTSTKWGPNPPAEFTTLVQGPLSYIPGITFIDNNTNGVYDPGVDTPLDSSFSFKGPLLGKSIFPGAVSLNMSSANQYFKMWNPRNRYQARYILTGKYVLDGSYFDPCTFVQGQVLGGLNCAEVNPLFLYSGDPVTQTGWINTVPLDQRDLVNVGPFKLEKNKPVDIIIAEIVGRGADALNSITVAKDYASNIIKYCNANFPNSIVTGIKDSPNIANNFRLDQNYPNPFNPSTKIRYSVRTNSLVTIKVYNILGKEVAVLLNENKNPGEYTVDFNAGKFNLASGVYFYRLTSGSFTAVKKMVLLK